MKKIHLIRYKAEDPLSAELTVEEDPLAADPKSQNIAEPEEAMIKLREELASQEDDDDLPRPSKDELPPD